MKLQLFPQFILARAVLVAGCLLGSSGCRKVESYEKPLTPVKVQTVEQQAVTTGGARYSASLQPDAQLDVASPTGGIVQDLLQVQGRTLEPGDRVAAGVALARLRDPQFAPRLEQLEAQASAAQSAQTQARAQLAEAHSAHAQLQREYERAIRLFEAETLTRPDFEATKAHVEASQARLDALQAQVQMAQAKVTAAQAQITAARTAHGELTLAAPLGGVVLKRWVERGAFVAPGAPLLTIADTTHIKAVFGVPDGAAAKLQPGSPLLVTSEALPTVELRGHLTRVAPAADPKTRIFDVEVRLPNPRQQLKPGMVVALQMADEAAPAPVTVVPLAALLQLPAAPDSYAVFVLETRQQQRFARQRRVQLGAPLGNAFTVQSGVSVGEQVVVSGATWLKDGEAVRVVP